MKRSKIIKGSCIHRIDSSKQLLNSNVFFDVELDIENNRLRIYNPTSKTFYTLPFDEVNNLIVQNQSKGSFF